MGLNPRKRFDRGDVPTDTSVKPTDVRRHRRPQPLDEHPIQLKRRQRRGTAGQHPGRHARAGPQLQHVLAKVHIGQYPR